MSLTDSLRSVPLFAGLTTGELDAVARRSRRLHYPRRSIVFHEGDPGDYLLVIITGRVKVTLLGEGGQETILAILEPPSFFGEISLLDEAPRSATVMTLDPTDFLQIAREPFMALIREHPAIAMKIMSRVARLLRQCTEQVRTLSMFDVHGRVLRGLLLMAQNRGESGLDRMTIRPRPSLKDLALMIGCSREAVSRALKVLQDTGYVTAVDGGLAIEQRAIRRYLQPALQNLAPDADQDD